MSEHDERKGKFFGLYKTVIMVAPILISLAALIISLQSFRADYRKNLPLLRVAYSTVERNADTPAPLFNGKVSEAKRRRLHFDTYFYRPLRDALGSGVQILNSSVVLESDEYDHYRAVEFILIENIHNAVAGRLCLDVTETTYSYPPTDLLKSLPDGQETTNIYRQARRILYNDRRIELAGLKPGEILAVPIGLAKPWGDLWSLFNNENTFFEIQVRRITYFDEAQTVPTILVPRSPLEYRTVITDTKDYSIDQGNVKVIKGERRHDHERYIFLLTNKNID